MTEPPEPRQPSDDAGGEDDTDWGALERDAVRDFVADSTPDMQEAIDRAREEYGEERLEEMVQEVLRRANDPMRYTADLEELAEDEAFEEIDDDLLLDQLGGVLEGDPEQGELVDMLGAWRDDVESIPQPPGTAPEVIQEIHDFTEEIDRATAPPRTQEGSVPEMSISEQAAQVAQIGNDRAAMGGVQNASVTLAEGGQVIAPEEGVTAALADSVEKLADDRANAVNLLGEGEGAQQVEGAGGNAVEIVNAAMAAALKAKELGEQYAAAVQAANEAISSARESLGLFYQTVADAAQRHGG